MVSLDFYEIYLDPKKVVFFFVVEIMAMLGLPKLVETAHNTDFSRESSQGCLNIGPRVDFWVISSR